MKLVDTGVIERHDVKRTQNLGVINNETLYLGFDVLIQYQCEAPGLYQESFKCSKWLFSDRFG